MSGNEHKASVDKTYLVKRHLKLEGEGDIPWQQIEKDIDQLMGIDEVHLDKGKHTITVAYDASYKSLEDIENILDQHFIHTADDWWTQTKKSWYEYTDDNIKANVKHEAWSCHSSPVKNKNRHQ
ncbi:cation transporter [Alkalimarinus coralli]|uniref:cation transporter n=1 Tax=Alkalimarinus coralli TaxID=2935863 RepID=UPI00202B1941|nr:cation transporter [Alkalimarinus coralli]